MDKLLDWVSGKAAAAEAEKMNTLYAIGTIKYSLGKDSKFYYDQAEKIATNSKYVKNKNEFNHNKNIKNSKLTLKENLSDYLSNSDVKKAIIKDIGLDDKTTLDTYLNNPVINKIITDPKLYKSYKKGFNVENIAKRLKGIKMSKTMELKKLGSIVRDNLYKDKNNKAQAWLTIFGPALKTKPESKNVAKINKYLKNKVKKIQAKFEKYSFFDGPQKMDSGEVKKLTGGKNLWQFIQDKKIVDDRFLLILYQGTDSMIRGDFFDILKNFFTAVDETISKDFKKFLVKIEDVKTFTSKKALHKLKISMLKACKLSNDTLDAINNEEKAFDNEQDEDEDEKIKETAKAAAEKLRSEFFGKAKGQVKGKLLTKYIEKIKNSKTEKDLNENLSNLKDEVENDEKIDDKEKEKIVEGIDDIKKKVDTSMPSQ
ncbi:MAG: hypothetical protein IJQ10_01050 [Clostridia bacterium]|nr:hypothetical protein [Clostridia bacterium]